MTDLGSSPPGTSPAPEPASLVRNSTWSLIAQAASIAFGGLVAIVAVRVLTVPQWGDYSTALALASLFVVFAELGVATVVLRRMSAPGGDHLEILSSARGAVGLSGALTALLLLPTAVVLGFSTEVLVVLIPAMVLCLVQPWVAVVRSVFTAWRTMVNAAALLVVQASLTAVVTLGLLATGVRSVAPMLGLVAGYAASALLGSYMVRRRLGRGVRTAWGPKALDVLRTSVPIAGVGLIAIVYAHVDVLMLSRLASPSEVAYYTVPYSIVRMAWLAPTLIASAYFPLLIRLQTDNPKEARDSFFLMARIFFVLSVPVSLFLSVSSPTLLPTLFGDAYGGKSTEVLAVMAWTCVLGFQNYILWTGVLAVHCERDVLAWQLAGLLINVALNVVLIPEYGAVGAAIALLVSDLLTVVGQAWIVHRHFASLHLLKLLGAPILAALIVVPVTVAITTLSPGIAGLAGGVLYAGILVVGRYVPPHEWDPVVRPLKARLGRA